MYEVIPEKVLRDPVIIYGKGAGSHLSVFAVKSTGIFTVCFLKYLKADERISSNVVPAASVLSLRCLLVPVSLNTKENTVSKILFRKTTILYTKELTGSSKTVLIKQSFYIKKSWNVQNI